MAAKLLLVEDDNNLREIYEARLQAEGYTIVTAKDGEEALVVAKAEKPDLIISDVMMPRISGFEMLDILRNTDDLRDTKVIMLTALGQADDKTRANSLGADRYLVKSQVTLEDIVKAAHELIEGGAATGPAAATAVAPTGPATPPAAPAMSAATAPAASPIAGPAPAMSSMMGAGPAVPAAPVSAPWAPVTATPSAAPFDPAAPAMSVPGVVPAAPTPAMPASQLLNTTPTTAQEEATVQAQIDSFANSPVVTPEPTEAVQNKTVDDAVLANAVSDLAATAAPAPMPAPAPMTPQPIVSADNQFGSVPIANKKVIQPLNSPDSKPDLNELMAREEAKSILTTGFNPGTAVTSDQPAAALAQPAADPAPAPAPASLPPVQPPANPAGGFDPNHIAL